MAYRDPLTGLWNRRYFEERLNEELSRSQRAGLSRKFSVMVLDLNDFKATNDRHGHPVGDTVLKDVGDFLITHLRHHDVACRTGGDEFTVLLPDLSAEDCGHLIDRLRSGLDAANATRSIQISLSIGHRQLAGGGRQPRGAAHPRRRGDVRGQAPPQDARPHPRRGAPGRPPRRRPPLTRPRQPGLSPGGSRA